jgi:hypothetical protein
MAGPKTRQKLQPRSRTALNSVLKRYLKDWNMEGIRGIHNAITTGDRPKNTPGIGHLYPNYEKPWNNPGPGSWWNASLGQQPITDHGIMLAAAGNPVIERAKNVYTAVDPFLPDLNKGRLRYDWNKPFAGGIFDYGIGYGPKDEEWDAYFRWGKSW